MNAIVKAQNANQLSTVTADAWETLKNSLYPGKSDDAVGMVISYCAARGYDPLKKPVHLVKMWNSDLRREVEVVLPGINQYRIDAARTGQYVGKSEPEFGPMITQEFTDKNKNRVQIRFPDWCKITVRRLVKGQIAEFTATEYWLECYATQGRDATAPNAMWEKRARGQLAKVAEAQALRMAFPEEMADYTAEEMEGKAQPPEMPPARGPQIEGEATRGPAPAAESFEPPPGPADGWPVLDRNNTLHRVRSVQTWVGACSKAVATLEDAGALAAWRGAMEEHFIALETFEPKAVEHVRGIAQDRLDDLAEAAAREAQDEGVAG